MYKDLILQATNCKEQEVGAVEQIMRDVHRTLDHLPRDRFIREARISYRVFCEMCGLPIPLRVMTKKKAK